MTKVPVLKPREVAAILMRISEQSYHLFRSKVSTFGADAETGGKKLPEWQRRWITQPGYLREKEVPVGSKEVIHAQDDRDPAPQA